MKITKARYLAQMYFAVVGLFTLNSAHATLLNTQELSPFVAQGQRILDYKIADLNRDGRKDVVIVTEDVNTDAIRGNLRTLTILLRDKTNHLYAALSNPNIIACSKCSVFAEEPFDPFINRRIMVKRGQFTIVQNFDIAFYPSISMYSFRYESKKQQFKTVMAKHIRYELLDSGRYKKHITNHIQAFGTTLNKFDPQWSKAMAD